MGGALYLNKIESFWLKYALCQVWFKLVQWFCRFWRFLIFRKSISLFYYPPKRAEPLFEKKIEFDQECFVLCLVEIGPVILERKKKEMLKIRQRRDRRANVNQESSLEPSVKVSQMFIADWVVTFCLREAPNTPDRTIPRGSPCTLTKQRRFIVCILYSVPSSIFHSYWDVTYTAEGLQD